MPKLEKLPAGKPVRFWSHAGGSPLPMLIPEQFKLFWFSYHKDGSFYTAGPDIAETVEGVFVKDGKVMSVFESILKIGAKISLHGRGLLLGPNTANTPARMRPFEFKQSLLGLTKPQLLCTHFIAPLGSYMQLFQNEDFGRTTDVFIDDANWWGSAVAVWVVALPQGSPIDDYTHTWMTAPLLDGKQVIIAAKVETAQTAQQARPPHHLIRVQADASRHQNWLLLRLRIRTVLGWIKWKFSGILPP